MTSQFSSDYPIAWAFRLRLIRFQHNYFCCGLRFREALEAGQRRRKAQFEASRQNSNPRGRGDALARNHHPLRLRLQPLVMTSYILGWLAGGETKSATIDDDDESASSGVSIAVDAPPVPDDGDESDSDRSDTPPAFPSLNSAQRLGGNRLTTTWTSSNGTDPLPKVLSDALLMPPPPLPNKALRVPGVPSITSSSSTSSYSSSSRSTSSSLLALPTSSSSSSSLLSAPSSLLGLPPSTTKPPVKKFRRKLRSRRGTVLSTGRRSSRRPALTYECVYHSFAIRTLVNQLVGRRHPPPRHTLPCSKSTSRPMTPGAPSAGKCTMSHHI